MFDMENSGEYICIIELKNLLGINFDKDSPVYEDKLWAALYQLYLENEIDFCKKDDLIDWINSIRPEFDQTTGKVVKYDTALFKRKQIADNREKLKKMLGFDTQQAIQEEKLFLSFLQNYPHIETMFELYKQGKNRKEIGDAVYKKSNSQSITGFLISPDSKNVSNSGWQKIYTNLVKGKSG